MKHIVAAVAAATVLLANAAPVFADDQHDRNHGGDSYHHAPPSHRHVVYRHAYREGQLWHGHRLANRGGNWGYYAPRNGAQIFIQIPI